MVVNLFSSFLIRFTEGKDGIHYCHSTNIKPENQPFLFSIQAKENDCVPVPAKRLLVFLFFFSIGKQ